MNDISIVARPYARAIFNIAIKDDELSAWSESLNILSLITIEESIVSFLARPDITDQDRVSFIIDLASLSLIEQSWVISL